MTLTDAVKTAKQIRENCGVWAFVPITAYSTLMNALANYSYVGTFIEWRGVQRMSPSELSGLIDKAETAVAQDVTVALSASL